MGVIFGGNGDINVEGVVGSDRFNEDELELDPTSTDAHTGIQHYGRGNVYVNDRRVR